MILAVCNSKGGVFKTGTAWNLCAFLNKHNPVLIDIDNQRSITYLNNIRQEHCEAFKVLTISREKELREIIGNNRDNLYIVDSGGFDSALTRLAIVGADLLLTPTTANFVDLLGLNRFRLILQELSAIKKQTIITNVFINNVSHVSRKFEDLQDYIKTSEHFNLLNTIIRTRADFPNAANKGLTVNEFNPVGKATQEFMQLSNEIENILYK